MYTSDFCFLFITLQMELCRKCFTLNLFKFHSSVCISGIVYCLSRNQAEQVASDLCTGGIKAACYHAEMSPDLRTKVHRQWTKNEIQVQ